MPGRNTPLVSGEYYHIYNRGSEKRNIYTQPRDYTKFQKTFYYYQFSGPKPKFSQFKKSNLFKPLLNEKLVEVICYCLMPNHFHFLARQLKDKGISIFISQLSNSYTKYFNVKYGRIGPLLQGAFKAVRIETDEQLVHVTRYIHLNPVVSGLVKKPEHYKWSSYLEYIKNEPFFCMVNEVLGFFKSPEKYQEFVENQIDYASQLAVIKHHLLDDEV
ncbi:transposase [Candidatus Daviesbacteria bacterium]|nr:transposase [Candidatus Daviesbacteria bacterium]